MHAVDLHMYMYMYMYMYLCLLFHPAAVAGLSVCLALLLSLLLFTLWFFTGYYYIFVILFGLAMGSLVSATILFTPLGKRENTLYMIVHLYMATSMHVACSLQHRVTFLRNRNILCRKHIWVGGGSMPHYMYMSL